MTYNNKLTTSKHVKERKQLRLIILPLFLQGTQVPLSQGLKGKLGRNSSASFHYASSPRRGDVIGVEVPPLDATCSQHSSSQSREFSSSMGPPVFLRILRAARTAPAASKTATAPDVQASMIARRVWLLGNGLLLESDSEEVSLGHWRQDS